VSDGMSAGTLAAADQLSRVARGRPLRWMEMYQDERVVTAYVDMRSLNSLVTDSSAASSSWGSGSRVVNGALNVLPDGRELATLAGLFGEAGWSRGLVTTTEITHATPAGFAVSLSSRGDAAAIADQYLQREVEVLLGGGRKYFTATGRGDKRDLEGEFRGKGYTVAHTWEALKRAPRRGRWLGLFGSGHLPFTVDHRADAKLQAEVPSLAEMTRCALERLEEDGRFLLQVEGGRVDHGAHSSDAPATLFDQIAFDEALDVCLEFQREQPDTLVVVTTDHGNSNPALNGMGSGYGSSPALLANLRRAKCSFAGIQERWLKVAGSGAKQERELADGTKREVYLIEPRVIVEVLEETVGYAVPGELAERFAGYLRGDWRPLCEQLDSVSAQLGQLLANHFGIGWTGTSHTSDYVPLVALGPGAERFRGFQKNTEVFRHYTGLAGIRYRNPELPLMAESGPTAHEAERQAWV